MQADCQRPEGAFAAKAASHSNKPRSRRGKLACKRIANGLEEHSRPRPLPTATNHEATVGDLLASELPTTRRSIRGQGRFPQQQTTKPPWEACLQANCQRPGGAFTDKAASHSNEPRSRRGRLACKRIANDPKEHSRPRPLPTATNHEATVGDLLASELPTTRRSIHGQGRFPQQQTTKPPWETCLQADCQRPGGAFAAKAASHSNKPRSHCGRLACKRIANGPEEHSRTRPLPTATNHEAAVGDLLASELPTTRRSIRGQGRFPQQRTTKPPWETCSQANCQRPEGAFAAKAASHSNKPRSRRGKLACKRMTLSDAPQRRPRRSARSKRWACWRASSSTSRT